MRNSIAVAAAGLASFGLAAASFASALPETADSASGQPSRASVEGFT